MATELTKAEIKIQRLADGSQLLTHPSGTQVLVTPKQLDDRRAALVKQLASVQAALTAFDQERSSVAALTPVAKPGKLVTVIGG